MATINVFEMDHRSPFVRLALATRVKTCLAPDTAIRVDEKLHVSGKGHDPCSSLYREQAEDSPGRRASAGGTDRYPPFSS